MHWLMSLFAQRRKRTPAQRENNHSPYSGALEIEGLEARQMLTVLPLASQLAAMAVQGPTIAPLAASDQTIQNDWSMEATTALSVSQNTGEKPQSKVWTNDGQWFAVLPNSSGTWIWRLDGVDWNPLLKLSDASNIKADVKAVGNVTHVLLFAGGSTQLASVEYVAQSHSYQFWSARGGNVNISLPGSTETATIDVDSQGRMWLAYDNKSANTIEVRYSDGLYGSWSAPIVVAAGVNNDDISSVIAMPTGQIGVFWSDQNSHRFGFRAHADGASPMTWSGNEVPASQSALNVGSGMADDHVNMAVASDGTLYAAVKTGYDNTNFPEIALLVRRPGGSWDPLYEVDNLGTRPIVVLNEQLGRLLVVYTINDGGGDIKFRETSTASIAFGPAGVLISGGSNNNVTSAKQNFTDSLLVVASTSSNAKGMLLSAPVDAPKPANQPPTVSAGPDLATQVGTPVTLAGSASDDGLPQPASLTTQWSVVSGPGTVSFGNASAPTTSATFGAAGTYILRLTASDGALSASDDATVSVASTPAPSPTPGVVGYWNFDGSGNPVADNSGNGNSGTLQGGATLGSGHVGGGLVVNGSGQYVAVPDAASLDISGPITIAAWIKPSTKGTQYVIKKAGHSSTDGFELSLSNTGKVFVRFDENSSGNTFRVDSTSSYPTNGNTWMHAVATYDGSTIRLYINGQLQGSKAAKFTIATNDLPLTIGAGDGGYRGMKGTIDDALIANRALSASEVAQLYQGTFMNPVNPPANQAPTVNAGPDQTTQVGTPVTLAGSATDDGLPQPASLTTQWSVVSGPGSVSFGNVNSPTTSATFNTAGSYVLQLTASDGALGSSDTVSVTVNPVAPVNQAPTVNAGPDQTTQVGTLVTLAGSATDDGLPQPASLTTQWSVVSGPGSVSFGNVNSPTTSATFNTAGSYVLRLTASDGALSSSDTVTVTVTAIPNPASGIVGYWNFDGSGSTIADNSGSGNSGTLQGGATLGSGHVGGGLVVNGSGQYVAVPDAASLDISGPITIAAWIKPSTQGTQYVVKKAGHSSTDGFELSLSNMGKVFVRFNENSSGNTFRVDSTSSYPTNGNTWMHVVATYDGSTIRLYINGQLQGSKAAKFNIATNDLPLTIGAGEDGYRGMKGTIDDVLIANRALSASEVTQLYQGTFPVN